jgi:hypothetical protein
MLGGISSNCHFTIDLKNTTDDALPNYLNSIGFKQSHYYTDVRLALGFSAVAIAGALFGVDWKLGWEVTKPWTLPAVLAYMVLNGAFTYWLYRVEGDKIYVGERKGSKVCFSPALMRPHIDIEQLEISTTTDKVNPTYTVKVRYTKAASKWTEAELTSSFAKWFSEDGYFVARPFQHFLASSIPVVGDADPKNAAPYVEPVAPPTGISTATDLKNVDITFNNVDDILAAINQGPQTRKRG